MFEIEIVCLTTRTMQDSVRYTQFVVWNWLVLWLSISLRSGFYNRCVCYCDCMLCAHNWNWSQEGEGVLWVRRRGVEGGLWTGVHATGKPGEYLRLASE